MTRRGKVVGATALTLVGASVLAISFAGGGQLSAAGIAETGFDWTKLLVWGGALALVASALLFISASAE